MIDEPDSSVGPAFLNFSEEYLCIGPRNRQAGNRWNTFPECAIRVLVRGEAWGHGISRVHGDELDRSTLDGVRVTSRAVWIPEKERS